MLSFSRSQKIHSLFEDIQKDERLKVLTLKRVNTVRWYSLEFCLKVFLERYSCIIQVLENVVTGTSFDENQRLTAEVLLTSFQLKQIVATACLFREIFAITGPLSRYLQSIDVDLGKATSMIDSVILQLEQLQNNEEKIVKIVDNDFDEAFWKENRVRRRRVLDGESSRDEPAVKHVALWKRNTFFSTMDTVVNSMKNRFEKNQPLLKSIALFAPSQFSELQRKFKTSNELQSEILSFCQTYGIDSFSCADELFSFSRSFKKFDCSILANESLDEGNTDIEDEDEDADLYVSLTNRHSGKSQINKMFHFQRAGF